MMEKQVVAPVMFCRQCGYELVGLSEHRCPECGRLFDPADRRTFARHPKGWLLRRWLRRVTAAVAILVICLILLIGGALGWLYWGWRAEQPTIAALRQMGLGWQSEYTICYLGFPACTVEVFDPGLDVRADGPAWLARLIGGSTRYMSGPPVYKPGLFGSRLAWLLDRTTGITWGTRRASREDLARLASLRHLKVLRLSGADLADEDTAGLAGLASLQEICLDSTNITDAGLEYLRGLSALRRLDLRKTVVSYAVIRNLEAVLPNLVVDRPEPLTQFSRQLLNLGLPLPVKDGVRILP